MENNTDDTETTDYTQAGGGEDGSDTDDGSEDQTDTGDGNDNQSSDVPDDDGSLKSLEKNLFADLTPEQMAIKNGELLDNFILLYDTLNTIFDDINKIPKNYNNANVLDFIANKIVEQKDLVNAIIIYTFSTKTYAENLASYKQCLLILQQINTMLKGLVEKPKKEDE